MKSVALILTIAIALLATGCKEKNTSAPASGQAIEGSFIDGAISFNQSQQQVVDGLYAKGFRDAAGLDKAHFDTIPGDAQGGYTLMKVLVPADTAGYSYMQLKWNNLQVQCDDGGLYSVTMHSNYAPKATIDKQYAQLLEALKHKGYLMQEQAIGQSQVVGDATSIVGYRYQAGGRIVQMHENDEDNGRSSISLIFNQM